MIATTLVILIISLSWELFYLAVNPPSHCQDDVLPLQGFVMWLVANLATGGWLISHFETWGWLPALLLGSLTLRYGFRSKERCIEREAKSGMRGLEDMLQQ